MVVVDKERGHALFDTLVHACRNKEFPFDTARIPHGPESLPSEIEWGSVPHALFLFCACYYMRGGIQSDTAILSLTRMYKKHPNYFDPAYVAERAEWIKKPIRRALRKYGLGFSHKQIARFWVENFVKMHTYWNGNPLKLVAPAKSYDEFCAIIIRSTKRDENTVTGFFGFREKMVSMFLYFLVSSTIIQKPFTYPVPVDFHVLRMLTAHKVLRSKALYSFSGLYLEKLLGEARTLTHDYCVEKKVNEVDLCDSLWLFSNTLCNQHPGNKSVVGKRKGRKTKITPFVFVWNETRVDRYLKTCDMCPVKATCVYQVPSAYYYIQGKLKLRGKHQRPPQLFLNGIQSPVRHKPGTYIPVHLQPKPSAAVIAKRDEQLLLQIDAPVQASQNSQAA